MATTTMSARLVRMGYVRARLLFGVAGLLIVGVLLAVLQVRGVDQIEVTATLLYAPIFLFLLFFGLAGGLLGALGATFVYVFLRRDGIDLIGWGEFAALVGARSVAYFLFGAVGGWASTTLEASLDKLDLYDQVDDLTGINNARFLLSDVDLEKSRANRYQTVFSVSFVDIDGAAIDALPTRRRRTVLRELGRKLQGGIRSMDRVAHGYDGVQHRVATILPETAGEGARLFHDRLLDQLRNFLVDSGVDASVRIDGAVVTVPGDETELDGRLEQWRRIDSSEHAAPRV